MHANDPRTHTGSQPDARLARGLWQALVLTALALALLAPLRAEPLTANATGWLLALPALALLTAYRHGAGATPRRGRPAPPPRRFRPSLAPC
jgi:hypothetical protein